MIPRLPRSRHGPLALNCKPNAIGTRWGWPGDWQQVRCGVYTAVWLRLR